MSSEPPSPSPEAEMAKHRAESEIERFKRLVDGADIESVGKDTEYVPDGPHARAGHPNVDASDRRVDNVE